MRKFLLVALVLALLPLVGFRANAENSITGPTEVGMTDTVTYSCSQAAPGTTYDWRLPRGFHILKGQGTPNLQACGTFLAQDGMVTVTRTSQDGTSDTLQLATTIYRPVVQVLDHTINEGQSYQIAGKPESLADIYYEQAGVSPQGRKLYNAHRLTVIPPDQVQLSKPYLQTVTDTSIWVTWKTSSNVPCQVQYGQDNFLLTVPSTVEKLSDSYFWHSAKLNGLTPETLYHYRINYNGTPGEPYTFKTAPSPGAKSHMRVLLMGDHQIKSRSGYEWLMRAAKSKVEQLYGKPIGEAVDMIMNVGDQVDAGTLQQYEQIHLYKSSPLSSILPIMTCVGNHETYSDPGMKNYSSHYHYEDLEYRGVRSGTENYYAYQIGRVLFVVLSTEHTGAAQKTWVRNVVEEVKNDPTVDFVISVNHRPIQAEQYIGDISAWVRNEIIPILSETPKHVLNFGGHHHLYHRGQLPDAPAYHIINGAASWNQLWGMSSERDYDDVQKTIDYWGYQIVDFDFDKKQMDVKCYAIGNRDIVRDNILIDSFSRKFGDAAPLQPAIDILPDTLSLPYLIKGSPYSSPAARPLNTTQFQFSTSKDFSTISLSVLRDVEDFYGSTGAPLHIPVDVNENLDITECLLKENGLKNGTYYVRLRYRDNNLEWSPWSEPKTFVAVGSVAGDPSISIDKRIYSPGESFDVNYQFAPTGQNAWIGIYKMGQKSGKGTPSTKWKYTPAASGKMTFSLTQPDEYYAVMFEDGGYNEITPHVKFVIGSAPKLSVDKSHYEVGEPVKVSYSNAPLLSNDWIGVYRMGQAHDINVDRFASSSWNYIPKDSTSGTMVLSTGVGNAYSLKKGYYYVGYFTRGQYFMPVDSVTFSVGDEISSIQPSKTNYRPNEDIFIDYYDGPGTPKDWLGFYREGQTVGVDELQGFYYTYGATHGTIRVPAGEQKAGDYFLALYINDSYDAVSNLAHISVGKAPQLNMKAIGETQMTLSFEDDQLWRDSVTRVSIDQMEITNDNWELSPGELTITLKQPLETCTKHQLNVQSQDWQDAVLSFEASTPTGMEETISVLQSLDFNSSSQTVTAIGFNAGDILRIYGIDGTLIDSVTLQGRYDQVNLPRELQGVFIARVGSRTCKFQLR